jgi:hypothetical protein
MQVLAIVFHGGFMLNRVKRPWLLAVGLVMCLASCDIVMGWLGGDEDWDDGENGTPHGILEPDPFDPNILSFYVDVEGDDDVNDGLSEESPFKTLAKAYTAALGSPDHKRIVVLSNLIEAGVVTLDSTAETSIVTIEGKTTGLKIERNDGVDNSVLEIADGAQIIFKNILINGKIADNNDGTNTNNRALKITGTGTKVTLGNGVTVTGKIATSSNSDVPSEKDGSGILIGGGAVLEMIGNSLVTGCKTITTDSDPKAAVVVYGEGTFTMKDSATVSYNTTTYSTGTNGENWGSGVYVHGSGSTFTMYGDTFICNNQSNSTNIIYSAGVCVRASGLFVMNDRAAVKDNTASSTGTIDGSGVYLYNHGKFEMNGNATVSGNTATSSNSRASGGGVYINSNGEFTMNGGVISGNTVTGSTESRGGGVYQASPSQFTMSGGVIYGNGAGNLSNIATGATSGAAYYKSSSSTVAPSGLGTTNSTITAGAIVVDDS